jgi:hypothetical protein
MYHALTSATLAELRRPRPYPAVSILMPTHRREPDNAQDPVRLRNLVAEAKERVHADPDVSRADRIKVVEQLEAALSDIDLVHSEEGLAVFVTRDEHQVWSLGRSAPARVVLSDTFLTRNLVATQAAERPYWVLVVAADHARLWSGGLERVTERTNGSFPLSRSLEDPDSERKERIGDLPSTFTDEQTRQFLREVDGALGTVLATEPRPLYVVGEAAALSLLDDVGTAVKSAAARIPHGGLAQGTAESVFHTVRPAVEEQGRKDVAEALKQLDLARGRKEFAAGIDEVWQKVATGRVALLAVEENYQVTVRDDGEHLVHADAGEQGAREDIVDEIVEKALDTGAQVRFVPDDELAGSGRIAAVLRY